MSLPLRVALSALARRERHAYGADPSQVADLHVPRGAGPHPVAVLLHGGYWMARYGRIVCRPLALDLVRHGWAVWNLEFRRLGSGGGWPATFQDVAAGVDALVGLADPRLDLRHTAVVGHSSGGQLALWAGGRGRLPPGAVGCGPVLVPGRVLALAPVTNLARAGGHARELLGGPPDQHPDRWHQADPTPAAPPPVPVLVVHPAGDRTIPVERSREYAALCAARGGDVRLLTPEGDTHTDPIDPTSSSWRQARSWLTGA